MALTLPSPPRPAPAPPRPQASQHERCRFRVTVSNATGAVPQEGHKVMLVAVMVIHKA